MVQVDEGPWLTCEASAAQSGLYTAPWTPDLLDDVSSGDRTEHELKVFVSDSNGRSKSLVQPFRIDMENIGKTTGDLSVLQYHSPMISTFRSLTPPPPFPMAKPKYLRNQLNSRDHISPQLLCSSFFLS
jgi:hypothetical protein